jgi:hypothetical protein
LEQQTDRYEQVQPFNLDLIQSKLNKIINSNIIVKSAVKSNKGLENFVMYVPELLCMVASNERGLEILELTGLYEYFFT